MEEAQSRKGTKIDVSAAAEGQVHIKLGKAGGAAGRAACVLGPGLELPLVVLRDEALNVRQLAVQVLAALLLAAVVGVGLRGMRVR